MSVINAEEDERLDGEAILAEVNPYIEIESVRSSDDGTEMAFIGRLMHPSDEVYRLLRERLSRMGCFPLLRRNNSGQDVIVVVRGSLPKGGSGTHPLLHLALLLVTFGTTLFAGASFAGYNPNLYLPQAFERGHPEVLWAAFKAGLPFALTLLAILGLHEMGHYVAARLHNVKVTLPFFIPMPFNGSLGTLGAVIAIRSPMENRLALFDIGIAGPTVGFLVALPLYMIGLKLPGSSIGSHVFIQAGISGVNVPPLLAWLGGLVTDSDLSFAILHRPVALAAWFGMLLTALNLIPMGQMDGGHVAYALLGRRAHQVAIVVFGLLVVMGLTMWPTWLIWALLGLLGGLRHPPPTDDITGLDAYRVASGILAVVVFALLILPMPFKFR